MIYIFIAFLSTTSYSLSCILDSFLTNTQFKKATTIVFFTAITNMMFTPFLFLFGTPTIPTLNIFLIISILSAIDVFYLIPWYMALKKIDTSISAALFSLGRVITPIMAWLVVNEKLLPIAYVGFFIIVAINFIMNFDFKKLKVNSAFYLMLIVSFMLATTGTMQKYSLNNVDFITILFWMSIISTMFNMSFLMFPKIRKDIFANTKIYKKNFNAFFATELFNALGGFFGIVSLAHMPVLLKSSLSSTQPMFILFLGWILHKISPGKFKESFIRRDVVKKLISFAVIIVGIILVMLGTKGDF